MIGPEAPLVAGVADAVRARGIPVFGPDRAAAALEGSKNFAKRIMDAAGVPTGRSVRATTLDEVAAALDDLGAPHVVKADGLAAGKGVIVTDSRQEALAHAEHFLQQGEILVEEFLGGPEVSLFFLADGHDVLPLSPAQDYKRVGDGDAGPNTGGMGAYSPLPWLDDSFGSEAAFVDEVRRTIALPTIRTLEAEGTPFAGLLYCGLVLTPAGIRVIEFNARFGDPETQVVLPRLLTPLSGLLLAAATGGLGALPDPEFSPEVAVVVVLASEGYPEDPITGRETHRRRRRTARRGDDRPRGDRSRRRPAARYRRTGARRRGARLRLRRRARRGLLPPSPASRSRAATTGTTSQRELHHDIGDSRLEAQGWHHRYSGKVRDLYESEAHPGRLLVVASDRVSAFDHMLSPAIPGKGALLTQLSLWWFGRLGEPTHLAARASVARRASAGRDRAAHDARARARDVPDRVRRARLPRRLRLGGVPEVGTVCGLELPAGLSEGDKLPEPIFTPAFKAPLGRARREHHVRAHGRDRGRCGCRRTARHQPADLRHGIRDRGGTRHPARRHEVRVRPRPGLRRRSFSPTRCSPPTRAGTGMPTPMPPAAWVGSTASTSRSCATGSPRTGIAPGSRPSCRPRSSSARPPGTRICRPVPLRAVGRAVVVELRDGRVGSPRQRATAGRPAGRDRDPLRHPRLRAGPEAVSGRHHRSSTSPTTARSRSAAAGLRKLDEQHGEIKRMYVVPQRRGAGVSTAILAHLEAEARSRRVGAARARDRRRTARRRAVLRARGLHVDPALRVLRRFGTLALLRKAVLRAYPPSAERC